MEVCTDTKVSGFCVGRPGGDYQLYSDRAACLHPQPDELQSAESDHLIRECILAADSPLNLFLKRRNKTELPQSHPARGKPDSHSPPLFVVFEGIDGAGTTTQAKFLARSLKRQGHPVVLAREPGGTEIGERIRDLLLNPSMRDMAGKTELLLYAASRAQLVDELIAPALNAGKPVISDRYTPSTIAYQGAGRGLDEELIDFLNGVVVQNCIPDITIYLDVSLEVANKRKNNENADRLELEGERFRERVAAAYRQMAADHPETSLLIDGTDGKNQLAGRIVEELRLRWPAFPYRKQ